MYNNIHHTELIEIQDSMSPIVHQTDKITKYQAVCIPLTMSLSSSSSFSSSLIIQIPGSLSPDVGWRLLHPPHLRRRHRRPPVHGLLPGRQLLRPLWVFHAESDISAPLCGSGCLELVLCFPKFSKGLWFAVLFLCYLKESCCFLRSNMAQKCTVEELQDHSDIQL